MKDCLFLLVLFVAMTLMVIYCMNMTNYYRPIGCTGFSFGERICESDKYYLEEFFNPDGSISSGFYLYEKVPNEQFIEGYELVLVTHSDNCTELKERVIRESNTYSIYGGR